MFVHPGCGEGRSALPACARGGPKSSRVCLFSKYWSKTQNNTKNWAPKVKKNILWTWFLHCFCWSKSPLPPKKVSTNSDKKTYFEHDFCIVFIGQNPSTPQKKWAPKVKESSNPYFSVTTFKRRTGQADSLVHPGCGEGRSALPACARGAPKISRVCLFSKYWSKSPKTPKSEHQI